MNIENIIDSYQQAQELTWREVVQVAEDMVVPVYSEVEMASQFIDPKMTATQLAEIQLAKQVRQ